MKQILIKEKRKGKTNLTPFLFSSEPTITNFPCLQSNQGEFQATYLTHGHKMHARGDMDWVEKILSTIVSWKRWTYCLMTCLIIVSTMIVIENFGGSLFHTWFRIFEAYLQILLLLQSNCWLSTRRARSKFATPTDTQSTITILPHLYSTKVT